MVPGGPPVGVGFALAPSSSLKARTMLFELDPLVEYAIVFCSVVSFKDFSGESALTYQYKSLVPVKAGSRMRIGAPFAMARRAPATPTPPPRSAEPEITAWMV